MRGDRRHPGPTQAAGVGPPKPKSDDDPALRAIERWSEARRRYDARRRELAAKLGDVPEWLRRWPGVFLGCETDEAGRPVAVHARDEKALDAYFLRRVSSGLSPAEARRLERRRAMALVELRLALGARRGAFAAAGLDPGDDDAGLCDREACRRLAAAEADIEAAEPCTVEGLLAKLRHATDRLSVAGDAAGARRELDHAQRVLRALAEDARLLRAAAASDRSPPG